MSSVKIRGGHRAMAVRLIQTIDDLLSSSTPEIDDIEVNLSELINHRDKMTTLDDVIIEGLSDEDEIETEMIECSHRKILIESCVRRVKNFKSTMSSTNNSNSSSKNLAIKLPQIHLPTFNGDSTEWLGFWDSFESAIHERSELSGAHKFNYLRGQLRGDALRLLEGFTLTNSNYIEAVDLLKETYGKPNKIILALLFKIFDLKIPNSTVTELNSFRSKYECYLRGIRCLRKDLDHAGFVLAALLIRKLPSKIQDNINRKNLSSDLWELDTFRKALNDEIDFIQAVENRVKSDIKSCNQQEVVLNQSSESDGKLSTAGTFSMTSTNNGNKFTRYYKSTCRFCDGGHITSFCDKFEDTSKRIDRARELHLCMNCLKNHPTSACNSKFTCYICGEKHHTALCSKRCSKNVEATPGTNENTTIACQTMGMSSVALPTAILPIKLEQSIVSVRAMLDQCAQKSLVLREFVQKVGYNPICSVKLTIGGFDNKGEPRSYDIVELTVIVNKKTIPLRALVVDSLPAEICVPGIKQASQKLELKGIQLADMYPDSGKIKEISVLVGADYYYSFVEGFKLVNGIHLIETCFGSMISGNIDYSEGRSMILSTDVITIMHLSENSDDTVEANFEKLWAYDSFSIDDESNVLNDKVLTKFKETIQFHNGQYIARLPWKDNHPKLPSNYQQAHGMLNSTLKSLRANPVAMENYRSVIDNQLKRNFIEIIDEGKQSSSSKVHYLPHHGILKRDSITTPLRIVFNCSSGNPSLNQCLHSGPSLVAELTHILLRFRVPRFVATSDIEKAFLMIALHEDDRDCTRFLWPVNPMDPKSKMLTYRFRVVLFGSTSSQFLLNASILYHLDKYNDSVSNAIKRNLYVDNLVCGFETESELVEFYYTSRKIMHAANLNLREWTSNSTLLAKEASQNKNASGMNNEQKVLGLFWKIDSDVIRAPMIKMNTGQLISKRSVLSDASKLYDPLGYYSPIQIRSKIFLQQLWKKKIEWDTPLEQSDQKKWLLIQQDLSNLWEIDIPRRAINEKEVTLHAFADASSSAMGVSIYFVDSLSSNIIFAKARVTPIKKLTMPKLELVSVTCMAKLVSTVISAFSQELHFKAYHFWSDSQIVLAWILNGKKLKPFVERRVQLIKELIPSTVVWHYVPSLENPADLASRGVSLHVLKTSELWFHGPRWLREESDWPKFDSMLVAASFVGEDDDKQEEILSSADLIDYERFSNYNKMVRAFALVYRFVSKLKRQQVGKSNIDFTSHNLSVEDILKAELMLIRNVQLSSFPEEFKVLLNNIEKKTGIMKQLNLIFVDNLLRCEGRIGNSDLDFDAMHPLLIPSKHRVSRLLIENCHRQCHHAGVNDTVATLRQRWWLPQIRRNVKSVLRSCVICKRYQGRPYKLPETSHLPPERTREAHPFEIVGVDFTGALLTKVGSLRVKRYIALFTCAVSRAVHLELVENLTADSFLNSFRRFVGRRSCPKIVYSDNATNFYSSSKVISEILHHPSVQDFSAARQCTWRFIPKKAPWFGGFWERLIGLTKGCIKKTLGRSLITLEQLQTLLIEVEARLNSRPLTYSSGCIEDVTPITPSHLFCGKRLDVLPIADLKDFEDDYGERSRITSSHRRLMTVLRNFWERWRKEYLVSLKEHHWPSNGTVSIEVGDVILVADNCSRLLWRLGKVEELIIGRDNKIRSAVIRIGNGTSLRPIKNLYPLEIRSSITENITVEKQEEVRRSKRKAAMEANVKIKNQQSYVEDS